MNVEYTGRQYEIPSAIRKEVETGLNKIRKILGDRFETKVTLAVEKRRHKAEISINPPNGPIVGLAQANDMVSAVNDALDHLHSQALKYKTKWLSKKRKAVKKFNGDGALQERLEPLLGLDETTTVSVTVHKFPSVAKTTEVHLVRVNPQGAHTDAEPARYGLQNVRRATRRHSQADRGALRGEHGQHPRHQ